MSWALYRVGFWIRETGQALDKVGCFLQGNASYAEEGEWIGARWVTDRMR